MEQSHCHTNGRVSKLDRKLKLTALLFFIVLAASFIPVPVLTKLNESLLLYVGQVWWAVLLGLVLGGVIDYFVPDEFISGLLGRKRLSSLVFAVLSGFLLSACSHGILALAIQLHKKGANNASVITFLLASPWANLPVTILLFGFFGWQAFLFIGAAMLIALVTGIVFLFLENVGLIEPSPKSNAGQKADWERLKKFQLRDSINGIFAGTVQLSNMVLWWILIGIFVAALIGAYVPHHVFMEYFGPSFKGLSMTLLLATVIEVCSEGSAPVAFEIFNKVGVLGNPFVFLMAGVVTDYTEIGLLWANVGKRVAIWLPLVTVPQVLFVGYLFNELL